MPVFRRLAFLALCPVLSLIAIPSAQAQQYNENRAVMERMDRLERDIMTVQKQVVRGGSSGGSVSINDGRDSLPATGTAQLEVRISAMEEDLRILHGKIEENEFQVKRLNENFEKMQKDMEFRFNELSGHPSGKDAGVKDDKTLQKPLNNNAAELNSLENDAPNAAAGDNKKKVTLASPGDKTKTTAGDGTLSLPKPADAQGEPPLDQPRDLYNYAFRLLNQTRYDDAAKQFKTFIDKYPKDPLVGNAYYWLGETNYIKRDYPQAADKFRQGFELMPGGPKAADNLLKLSMTLSAMKRDDDACTVLSQLLVKFKTSSTALLKKAEAERSRIGCK